LKSESSRTGIQGYAEIHDMLVHWFLYKYVRSWCFSLRLSPFGGKKGSCGFADLLVSMTAPSARHAILYVIGGKPQQAPSPNDENCELEQSSHEGDGFSHGYFFES
jgi:hypothetical protein